MNPNLSSLAPRAWAACAAIAVLVHAGDAAARACTTASDCPKGFTCEGGTCTSLPCQSDSDCGPALSCYVGLGTECETGPDGGQSCFPGSACVPQWDAPCSQDADCGPGFTCSGSAGYYQCGPNQASVTLEPYETETPVPCSAVLPPVPPGGPSVPSICDAGSTCLSITYKTCVAVPTSPCTESSSCPSTWTCGCPATCTGVAVFPGDGSTQEQPDTGCTLACIPPNSDLLNQVCAGTAGGVSGGTGSSGDGGATAPYAPAEAGAGSEGATSGGGSHGGGGGGCAVGLPGDGAGRLTAALAALGCILGLPLRRRRPRPSAPRG